MDLDKSLLFLALVSEQDINGKIAQWKANGINASEMSQALTLHEYSVAEARKAMERLLSKAAGA